MISGLKFISCDTLPIKLFPASNFLDSFSLFLILSTWSFNDFIIFSGILTFAIDGPKGFIILVIYFHP